MRTLVASFIVLVMGTIALVHAAAPTTKPSAPAGGRLFAPYSKMTSLTDEQRVKIHDIHKKVLADIREIEKKQTDEIAALLNDDQKKELRELEEATAKKMPKKDASEE